MSATQKEGALFPIERDEMAQLETVPVTDEMKVHPLLARQSAFLMRLDLAWASVLAMPWAAHMWTQASVYISYRSSLSGHETPWGWHEALCLHCWSMGLRLRLGLTCRCRRSLAHTDSSGRRGPTSDWLARGPSGLRTQLQRRRTRPSDCGVVGVIGAGMGSSQPSSCSTAVQRLLSTSHPDIWRRSSACMYWQTGGPGCWSSAGGLSGWWRPRANANTIASPSCPCARPFRCEGFGVNGRHAETLCCILVWAAHRFAPGMGSTSY